MKSTFRALLLIALALTLTPLVAAETGRRKAAAPPSAPTAKSFAIDQKEFYLTDDGIAYIRPGLKVKVNSVTIGSDRKPVIDLTLTDDFDNPIDRLGKTTPGAISLSYILAWYNPATRQYTSYVTRTATAAAPSKFIGAKATQAAADSGGTVVDLSTGSVKYTFGNALPAGFDGTKTHTLGIYATRNLTTRSGRTTTSTSSTTSGRTGRRSPKPGPRSTWPPPATTATIRSPHTAARGATRSSARCAISRRPPILTPATPSI